MKKKRYAGLISAFVIIMFGMVAICYLMGFDSAWGAYTKHNINKNDPDGQNITEAGAINEDLGDMMINGIKGIFSKATETVSENPLLSILGLVIAGVGMYFVGRAGGAQVFAYIIPIVLIVIFANIFIFPISDISGEIRTVSSGVPIEAILLTFFNLFLFLAIIDFVSGGRT